MFHVLQKCDRRIAENGRMPQTAPAPTGHPIRPDERSGMLHPRNAERFAATWLDPHPSVADVVDRDWHVTWSLPAGERIDQRIIDHPAVTLTIESGDVPAPLVVTGVQRGAWRRGITGSGSVFAIRLRPAGSPSSATSTCASSRMPRRRSRRRSTPGCTVCSRRSNRQRMPRRGRLRPTPRSAPCCTNDRSIRNWSWRTRCSVELADRVRRRTGTTLAARFGVSDRAVQRALARTVGHGPKWVARRVRLQEVARVLSTDASVELADLAVRLGYTDQSHLSNDFRGVVGLTPGAYQRSVREAAAAACAAPSSDRPVRWRARRVTIEV